MLRAVTWAPGSAMHVTPFRASVELGTPWLKSSKGMCFGRAAWKTSNLSACSSLHWVLFKALGFVISSLAVPKKIEMAENI